MSSRRDAAPSEDGASTTGAHALSLPRPPATRGAARGLPAHTRRLKCKPRDARSRAHAAPSPSAASLHRLRLCKATGGEPGRRAACPRGLAVKSASGVTHGPWRRRALLRHAGRRALAAEGLGARAGTRRPRAFTCAAARPLRRPRRRAPPLKDNRGRPRSARLPPPALRRPACARAWLPDGWRGAPLAAS